MKTTVAEMKSVLDVMNSRLDISEIKESELEDIVLKTIQGGTQRKKAENKMNKT